MQSFMILDLSNSESLLRNLRLKDGCFIDIYNSTMFDVYLNGGALVRPLLFDYPDNE